ncbi:crotonase [Tardibacter chloracetimidivorans]|uniref:Crotonase n=1 Tax=Tardibacter chloracetimidivorans TaxID=1921510 RepID=A0A1L3ZSS7_9SPHN|nr:enoyl-CoA hydratase/isomerase family protein [Tardibacter chloracetimidivorans]API58692.1 crotonase [Tardibacter chloracetimidivorans]
MSKRPAYFDKYQTLNFERHDDGVLVVTYHSDGGPVLYCDTHHAEWAPAFTDIGMDRDNRVVIFTGTGDTFIDKHGHWERPMKQPRHYEIAIYDQTMMFRRLLEIEVPVICAVNGPALIHSELVVVGDITLCSEKAVFADDGHFPSGEAPGDGIVPVWQELLGVNRGTYFVLTGQRIDAHTALELGIANEVLPHEELMPRALDLAHSMATYTDLTLRATRLCTVDRWKRVVSEKIGFGYGMNLECMAHMDRGWMVWDGTNQGNEDANQLRTLKPRDEYLRLKRN